MNERIRELAEQATHVEGPDGLFLREVLDHRKFAELIIRECASLAYDGPGGILEHFGLDQPKGFICPKCGTDRTKSACPRGYGAAVDGSCPMIFAAQ